MIISIIINSRVCTKRNFRDPLYMRSTSSFCHRINLLNEDLNVRASSLGGVAEAEELHPEPPFPPSEYVPTFRSSFKRFTR